MKSEHDYWGELRALRKRQRQWRRDVLAGNTDALTAAESMKAICERRLKLSWALESLITKKYGNRCPRCGGPVAYGYGLAGGGMGSYTYCVADSDCDWFFKVPDREGDPCLSA